MIAKSLVVLLVLKMETLQVMAMHNLWRAKQLYDLSYGQPNFRSRDSKKVQEIISEAGKGSYAALGVELKRYYVNV